VSTELELTQDALKREISRGIAVDAELNRQRQRAEKAEADLVALRSAIQQVREIHSPEQYHDELQPWCTYCNRDDNERDDVVLWPCPTLAALGINQ
jgi:hypothetical protein